MEPQASLSSAGTANSRGGRCLPVALVLAGALALLFFPSFLPGRALYATDTPLSFLTSQIALFLRPLTPLGRWHDYVVALDDEQGWKVLQRLVEKQDC